MRRTPPVTRKLSDEAAELVRQNHERRITELAQAATFRVIPNVVLPSATIVWVPHGLGRRVLAALPSAPRTPDGVGVLVGLISEARGSIGGKPIDSAEFVVLFANNFGVTVTIDLVVF